MIEYEKKAVLEETVRILERSLYNVKESTKDTKERAIQAPSASESHSDTSKNQLQDLSFGLDQRIYALESEIASLKKYEIVKSIDKVILGTLVGFENINSKEKKYCYILPAGAGTQIETNRGQVNIITTSAPLFVAMRGKEEGDEFAFKHKNSRQEYFITKVN